MSRKDKIVGSAAIVVLGIIFFIVGYFINNKTAFNNKELMREVEIANEVLNEGEDDDSSSISDFNKKQLDDEDIEYRDEKKNTYSTEKDYETSEIEGRTNIGEIEYIVVDIEGAVNKPGVYTIEKGKRLNDLIYLAGGVIDKADMKSTNKAVVLCDEGYYYIYSQGEEREYKDFNNNTQQDLKVEIEESDNKKININKASISELMTIPGIGEVRAKSIIDFRENNNGFKSVEELKKISGIGEKTYDKLSQLVDIR